MVLPYGSPRTTLEHERAAVGKCFLARGAEEVWAKPLISEVGRSRSLLRTPTSAMLGGGEKDDCRGVVPFRGDRAGLADASTDQATRGARVRQCQSARPQVLRESRSAKSAWSPPQRPRNLPFFRGVDPARRVPARAATVDRQLGDCLPADPHCLCGSLHPESRNPADQL